MQHEQLNAGLDAVKMAPGGAYLGLTLGGVTLPDVVAVLTGIYMLAQIVLLVPKYLEWYRTWQASKQD